MRKEWELIKNIYGCTTILMQETEAKETENAFKVVEKSLKALEIIKKKEVSVRLLKSSYTLLEYYTKYKSRTGCNTELTEEEFKLLKEVLE